MTAPTPSAPGGPSTFRSASRRVEEAVAQGDKPAVVCGDTTYTWAAFGRAIAAVSTHLTASGVRPGDRVVLVAGGSAEYVVALFGALRAGAVIVPLSPMAADDVLERMIADCDPVALFLDAAARARLKGAVAGRTVIAFDPAAGPTAGPAVTVSEIVEAPFDDAGLVDVGPDDGFDIIYSSGTTGVPKGVPHSQAGRSRGPERWPHMGFDADSVVLVVTPLYANLSFIGTLGGLLPGGTIVVMPKFDERRFHELARRYGATQVAMVPVQCQRILAVPDFDTEPMPLRATMVTGAPMPLPVKRAMVDRWPGRVFELYSQTEGGPCTELDLKAHPDKLDTVGQPIPTCDVRIVGDDGREAPPGVAGEVVGNSGPYMLTGYFGAAPDTSTDWHSPEGARFHRSGDIGVLGEDGFLRILDRKKDVIISGGINVYAADIESILVTHPKVEQAVAFGAPSERWGETPVAIVTLHPGESVPADDLKDWANGQVSKFARLSALVVVDEIPRNALGKVVKRDLRERFAAICATR